MTFIFHLVVFAALIILLSFSYHSVLTIPLHCHIVLEAFMVTPQSFPPSSLVVPPYSSVIIHDHHLSLFSPLNSRLSHTFPHLHYIFKFPPPSPSGAKNNRASSKLPSLLHQSPETMEVRIPLLCYLLLDSPPSFEGPH